MKTTYLDSLFPSSFVSVINVNIYSMIRIYNLKTLFFLKNIYKTIKLKEIVLRLILIKIVK